MLLLKAMRRIVPFGNYPMPLRINNKTLWFNDGARSDTREIVLSEIHSGFYDVVDNIPDGAVILDIGAHVGIFSIPLAIKFPNVNFICVEPNKKNYENLYKNRERYKLNNVMLINAGVWDKQTQLSSLHERMNTGGSRTFEIPNGPNSVNSFTLSDLRELFCSGKNANIWLLKMDCEGAEFKAIKYASDIQNIERFIGEVHAGKAESKENEAYTRLLIQRIPRYRYVYLNGKNKTIHQDWS